MVACLRLARGRPCRFQRWLPASTSSTSSTAATLQRPTSRAGRPALRASNGGGYRFRAPRGACHRAAKRQPLAGPAMTCYKCANNLEKFVELAFLAVAACTAHAWFTAGRSGRGRQALRHRLRRCARRRPVALVARDQCRRAARHLGQLLPHPARQGLAALGHRHRRRRRRQASGRERRPERHAGLAPPHDARRRAGRAAPRAGRHPLRRDVAHPSRPYRQCRTFPQVMLYVQRAEYDWRARAARRGSTRTIR